MELKDTIDMMLHEDYKERFKAEYWQTKIRYERLKKFNTRIEAAQQTQFTVGKKVERPRHDCPDDLLKAQQQNLGEYLHILEIRAEIEMIDLAAEFMPNDIYEGRI